MNTKVILETLIRQLVTALFALPVFAKILTPETIAGLITSTTAWLVGIGGVLFAYVWSLIRTKIAFETPVK